MARHCARALVGLLCLAAAAGMQLNCGGPAMPGTDWMGDTGTFVSGGTTASFATNKAIFPPSRKMMLKTHCWAPKGDLIYKIPSRRMKMQVDLHFCETWTGSGPGVRMFRVEVNGKRLEKYLDVYTRAGGFNKELKVTFNAMPERGMIVIKLLRVKGMNNPMISGIVTKPAPMMMNAVVV